jgi:hypothetical protein
MATICKTKLISGPQISYLAIERSTKMMDIKAVISVQLVKKSTHESTDVGDCHLDDNHLQDSIWHCESTEAGLTKDE